MLINYKKEMNQKQKNELPITWEEYLDSFCVFQLTIQSDVDNLIKKFGQKYAALYKLEKLRDCWRQGWEPNWDTTELKHCVNKVAGHIQPTQCWWEERFLAFKDSKTVKKFINNFNDLITQAEDLI